MYVCKYTQTLILLYVVLSKYKLIRFFEALPNNLGAVPRHPPQLKPLPHLLLHISHVLLFPAQPPRPPMVALYFPVVTPCGICKPENFELHTINKRTWGICLSGSVLHCST